MLRTLMVHIILLNNFKHELFNVTSDCSQASNAYFHDATTVYKARKFCFVKSLKGKPGI